MDTTTEVLRKRVIRERETEQRLRGMDTHELVALVHSLEDERDALAQERDDNLKAAWAMSGDVDAMAAERDAARAEVAQLREALQMMWDSACTNPSSTPSIAAFFKARAALAATEKPK